MQDLNHLATDSVPARGLPSAADPAICLQEHLARFMATMEHRLNSYGGTPRVSPVKLIVQKGPRYLKIVVTEQHEGAPRYVAGFVDTRNGDVFKAASWKAPAKHARGNLFASDGGLRALTPRGSIVYLT